MTEERRDRLWALFDQAADLSPPEQCALLDAACPDDPDLRAAVEKLLADDARVRTAGDGTDFLQSPLLRQPPGPGPGVGAPTPEHAPTLAPTAAPAPPRIGRYCIVRLLGEGGMGTVYEAEQDNPRRAVALKVIRPGLVSPELLRRFAREAQILGRLHHPGIAQVYDAGVAVGGQPYFAMELIAGVPLDRYANEHALDAPGRLELLARVCDAVQHAHESGVIHRDLKPSNILVEASGQPRVLDFGVARAADAGLTAGGGRTEAGQLIGTLSYMSPEQACGDPSALGPLSDVYALGVILYELLAHRLPYSLDGLPLHEAARVICEQEAARLGLLDGRLRGDVETIAAKALEKEPPRRYGSAAELAADIRRHLCHEPIRARPPSALYQLGKFVRRHKALVITTVAFLAVLLVGGAMTAWQAVQLAQAERDQAVKQGQAERDQARRSRDVQDALAKAAALREQARKAAGDEGQWAEARAEARKAEGLVQGGPVEPGLAERVKVLRDELDEEQAGSRLVARLDRIRLLQAEVNVKKNLFALERSLPKYRQTFADYGLRPTATTPAEAAALLRRRPAVRDTVVAGLDDWLAVARLEKAAEVGWLERVLAAADPDDWRQRLRAAVGRRDQKALEDLAREVKVATPPPQALVLLGRALQHHGSPESALLLLRRAQDDYPGDFWVTHDLGRALGNSPQHLEEAIRFLTVAVALRPESAGARLNLGTALWKKGRLDEAGAVFRKIIALKPNYAQAHHNLGTVLLGQKDVPGAEKCLRRAIELDPMAPLPHLHLGGILQQQGDLPGAEAHFRRATMLDPKNPLGPINLGVVLVEMGNLSGAAASYRTALAIDPKNALAHFNRGVLLVHQGEFDAALAELHTSHDLGYPSAKWIQGCESLIKANNRLPAILQGARQPQGVQERLDLAVLCRYKRLYSTSVQFFTEALAAEPRLAADVRTQRRYRAACAAVLASCGHGAEAARPDESERARLRRKALQWLHADLAGWARLWEGGTPEDRAAVRARLGVWQIDPALAGVRDADRLATLPAAERAGWEKLWADVATAVARARKTK
jgi:tetratricopeptide (TPR) repeat protein